jgi:ATP-dependent helicase HrpA
LPPHLRTRIEIVGRDAKSIGAGRDLDQLRQQLREQPERAAPAPEPAAWRQAAQRWERYGVTGWTFGALPERITVTAGPGLPLYGWPGLEFLEGTVNVRLFRSQDDARHAGLAGLQRLVELAILKDLAWLEKDLRALDRLEPLYASLGDIGEFRESALEHLKRHLLPAEPLAALDEPHFQAAVETARQRIPGLGQQLVDRLGIILQLRHQVQSRLGLAAASAAAPTPARKLTDLRHLGRAAATAPAAHPLAAELVALVPPRFPERVAFDRLPHLPRYLKALLTRLERGALNPVKDQERARQIAPYVEALRKLEAEPKRSAEARRAVEEFRWMIEEFKVSLFAQELGTAVPVSAKRLDQQLERARMAISS